MDNEYNYYKPDENEELHQRFQSEAPKPERPKRKMSPGAKKAITVAGCAVMFGVIGGLTFQGTNYVTGKLIGSQKEVSSETASSKVSGTKLTTASRTVTSDVSEVVDHAMPSIVSITSMTVQQVQSFFGGTRQQEMESAGSGIIISQNDTELLIVTNNHVVEGSDTLTVTFNDNASVEAQIKGTDAARDLAVVAVSLEEIGADTMDSIKIATVGDSDSLKVGEPAIAIGNALGYGQSVTTGIISATERGIKGFEGEYIQTDAAINPGNSGGALLNINGEVVGINSAKINSEVVEGMGYAIPVSDVSDIIENLMNQATRSKVPEAERGYLGIRGVDVTADSAQVYDMPTGVYVREAISGGGAEKADITKGCIITGFEGTTIDSMETLQNKLAYYRKGETVTLTIQMPSERAGYEEREVQVTLGENP